MVEARVTFIDRGRVKSDLGHFVTGDAFASRHEQNPTNHFVDIPIYNFVIEHPEVTLLMGTGCHPDAMNGRWPEHIGDVFYAYEAEDHPLDEDLEEHGYSLDDIDAVFLSHLHLDHTGGLDFFAGTDVPVFVHKEELEFGYFSAAARERDLGYIREDLYQDLNWVALHGDGEEYFEGLRFLHLPGHTPGHTGLRVDLEGSDPLVLAADAAHRWVNYDQEAPPSTVLLECYSNWIDSIRRLKDLERRENARIIVGHDLDQPADLRSGWG